MAYRKKTLRIMSPTARKVARLTGELESIATRLKNLIPDIQRLDLDSKALFESKRALTSLVAPDELPPDLAISEED
jgi:hypothetical protein